MVRGPLEKGKNDAVGQTEPGDFQGRTRGGNIDEKRGEMREICGHNEAPNPRSAEELCGHPAGQTENHWHHKEQKPARKTRPSSIPSFQTTITLCELEKRLLPHFVFTFFGRGYFLATITRSLFGIQERCTEVGITPSTPIISLGPPSPITPTFLHLSSTSYFNISTPTFSSFLGSTN